MSTLLQYTNEDQPNKIVFTLDDEGNLQLLGGVTQTPGTVVQATGSGLAATSTANVGGRKSIRADLTSAQLLALHATPVLLIPAPAAGTFIRVLNYELLYTFLTSAYTNTNATLKLFQGTTANAVALTADLGAILTNTASRIGLGAAPVAVTDTLAHIENVGIFAGNDGSAEFLAGAGSLSIFIDYETVTP
jgi:hypothetical protein